MNTQLIDRLTQSSRAMLALEVAVKATLVLAAAAIVAIALRRSSAAGRHLAWCLGLGAALLDPARRRGGPRREAAAIALLAAIFALVPLATLRVGARTAGSAASAREPIESGHTTDDPVAQMTVTGRVLDPSGKPVADAAVMVIAQAKQPQRPMFTRAMRPVTEHQGRCDGSGRFRIALPRTSSARHDGLVVTALAPGYGVGWTELDPDADPPTGDVALRPEQVIRGQLFDVPGQSARGVAIRFTRMRTAAST